MRIRISKENDRAITKLNSFFKLTNESTLARVAFACSIQSNKLFDLDATPSPPSDGRDFRDERMLFGTVVDGQSNYPIFKSIMDQHYNRVLFEDEFIKLFKLHLDHGLSIFLQEIEPNKIASGSHFNFLMKIAKRGVELRKNVISLHSSTSQGFINEEYTAPLSFMIGQKKESNEDIEIKINDLREFDNRNIAIAGMAGSGKTQLVKDILYQISRSTENQLKFIFFDYKGEGNVEQLKSFLDLTHCDFVDILNDSLGFNPLTSISLDNRQMTFSIKAFVDTIATFVPNIGVSQKNILQTIISDLINEKNNQHPSLSELFEKLDEYYEEAKIKKDTLYAAINDLSSGLFSERSSKTIFQKSIYLNLPPTLSDTLRQLCVFLLLRYFNFYFSSTNDVEPKDNIIPLRYVIVIDEAHIYLKNKNARKALEELLRLLRSKGVVIMMLSQGVEDYKTKDFDFASQVKLPICLNIQNKDFKLIKSFLGTPRSEHKLQSEISKLDSGLGIVNLHEPELFTLRQFWKTVQSHKE